MYLKNIKKIFQALNTNNIFENKCKLAKDSQAQAVAIIQIYYQNAMTTFAHKNKQLSIFIFIYQ